VETILEAATRVFDQHGYAQTTTNLIAERAGVSIGSLYQYFPNKDALLTALHERHTRSVLEIVREHFREDASVLPDVLSRIVRALLAMHRHMPRLQQVLHTERPWLEAATRESAAATALLQETIEWLDARRADVTVMDRPLAAATLLRSVESLIHAAVLDPVTEIDDERLEYAIVEVALGYLVLPRADV
jgi:AcrR family transcriptional regulator